MQITDRDVSDIDDCYYYYYLRETNENQGLKNIRRSNVHILFFRNSYKGIPKHS